MSELDKGAVTRMDNTIAQAKRQTMPGPGSNAAQASLRHQVKGPKRQGGSPVGDYSQVVKPQPVNIPTGGPQLPPNPEFDAGVFKQDMADSIVGQIRTNNFLNSAAAKDAMTSVQLKEMFNQFNPNKKPDPRSLVDRVVNRMGLNPNEESA
jgi:hypothetical protein